MHFDLSEKQALMRKLFREFSEKEVKPIAAVIDEEERFPVETVEKIKSTRISIQDGRVPS